MKTKKINIKKHWPDPNEQISLRLGKWAMMVRSGSQGQLFTGCRSMGKGWPTECKHFTNSDFGLFSDCNAGAPIRVIMRMEAATYGESVNWRPSLARGDPIGPIENGITYIVRPRMHPGKRASSWRSISSSDIQLPNIPVVKERKWHMGKMPRQK